MKKILILIVAILFPTMVFAKNITKADLETAVNYYNNICDSDERKYFEEEDGTCEVPQTMEVTNDKIIITDTTSSSEPEVFEFNYVINDDNTISLNYVTNIANGMTQEQYQSATQTPLTLLYPAMIIAQTQGAKIADYGAYLVTMLLSNLVTGLGDVVNGTENQQFKYIIISDGVTIDTTDDYDLVINESQFGDYVMRIAEGMYRTPISFKDDNESEGQINSFVFTTTFTKMDDDNGVLTSTIKIDPNADYTKVAGMYEKLDETFPGESQNNSIDPVEDLAEQAKEDNPKTGAVVSAIALVSMLIFATVLYRYYSRRTITKL